MSAYLCKGCNQPISEGRVAVVNKTVDTGRSTERNIGVEYLHFKTHDCMEMYMLRTGGGCDLIAHEIIPFSDFEQRIQAESTNSETE